MAGTEHKPEHEGAAPAAPEADDTAAPGPAATDATLAATQDPHTRTTFPIAADGATMSAVEFFPEKTTAPDGGGVTQTQTTAPVAGREAGFAGTLPSQPAPSAMSVDDEANLTLEHPGRYELVGLLGEGGIGRVLLARDQHLEREVAVKELLPEHTSEGSRVGPDDETVVGTTRTPLEVRFLSEARITGRLEHPSVVPVYELGKRDDGTIYYTMKMVRGRTLSSALKGQDLAGRMKLLPNFVDLCQAMAYAHSRGVIHRDLKPENVMLGDFGETIVLDWGLAKVRHEKDAQEGALADELEQLRSASSSATVAGRPIGTPAYMAPEQADGNLDEIDERSDVYALGAVLYEILTGKPPFRGGSALAVILDVLRGRLQPPAELEPRCPAEAAAIAMRALSFDKARRYPDAKALAADVLAFETGGLVRAYTYRLRDRLARWMRRHWKALAVSLLVVAGGVFAWWYGGHVERVEAEQAEAARQEKVAAEVDSILDRVARGEVGRGWSDTYAFKLISLKEPQVESRLVQALDHPRVEVRSLAARALGGMKSELALPALIARLDEAAKSDEDQAIEIIRALAIIGDWRAEKAVADVRWAAGQHSKLWRSTELAYEMIPLAPLDEDGGALSAMDWYMRGRALQTKDKLLEARAAYDQALELDPKLWRVLNNRSIIHKRHGDLDKALADLDAAILHSDKPIRMIHNRALLRRDQGDMAGALADLDQVVAVGSFGSTPLRTRARLRQMAGDWDGARKDLEAALAKEPDNPTNHLYYGHHMLLRNDLDKALASLDRALAYNQEYLAAFVSRAWIHDRRGRPDNALADLDRVMSLDPGYQPGAQARAIVRMRQGNPEGALEDLERSLRLDQKDGLRWAARGVIYHAQRRDLANALKDLQAAIERAHPRDLLMLLFMGLAVALEAGDEAMWRTWEARLPPLAALQFGWHKELRNLFDGRTPPSVLEAKARHTPIRLCDMQLVMGVASALRKESAEAAHPHYQAASKLQDRNELACILATALAVAPTP